MTGIRTPPDSHDANPAQRPSEPIAKALRTAKYYRRQSQITLLTGRRLRNPGWCWARPTPASGAYELLDTALFLAASLGLMLWGS